jgi:hypothetical protein
MPLVIGGVAALVVVVGVVAFFAFSSGDTPPDVVNANNSPGSPNAGNSNAGAPDTGPTRAEKEQALRGKLYSAKSVAGFRSVFDEAKKSGFGGLAKEAAQKAWNLDETLDWANEAIGRKNLKSVYERIPTDNQLLDDWPNDAYTKLIELREFEGNWGTDDDLKKAEEWLTDAITHGDKLQNDASYRDEYVIRLNVARDPLFKDYSYKVEGRAPYVIFVEHTGKETQKESEKAQKIVKRNADLLEAVYVAFHEIFGEKFKLPKLAERPNQDERVLRIFTFFNRENFDKYQRAIGMPLPPGAAAYYRPSNRWVTLYEGGKFEQTAAKGETPFNVSKVVHEGAHQLIHVYTKIMMEKKRGEEISWNEQGTHSRSHWFQEGMAEFFGAVSKVDGKWKSLQIYHHRLREWRRTMSAKKIEWELPEMLRIASGGQLQMRSRQKGLAMPEAVRLSSLYYAQSWTFCHFLYFHENGKYRDKLMKYAEMEFTGVTGYEAALDKEWRAYVDKMMKDHGI